MANPNSDAGWVETPILKEDVNDAIGTALRVANSIAPVVYIDKESARVPYDRGLGFIAENEEGADPRIPQARRSPAIELLAQHELVLVGTEIFRRKMYLNRLDVLQADDAYNDPGYIRERRGLVRHIADLVEWKTAEIYQDSSNYDVNNEPLDLTSLDAGGILAAFADAADGIKPSNAFEGDDYGIRIVLSRDVWAAVMAAFGPVINKETGFANSAQVSEYLRDATGEPLEVFVSGSRYVQNVTGNGESVPMWGSSLAAISVVSDDPASVAGFANTIATNQASYQDDGDMLDRVEQFLDVYAASQSDPRGTNVHAEALFKVVSNQPDRAIKFDVTLP